MPRVAASRQSRTYVPDDAQEAGIADFVRVLGGGGVESSSARPALVGTGGERIEIPESMFEVLRQIAESLSSGMGVTVAPLNALLTTQEAADHLGLSRPTLVRMLERGDIPMEKPGRHRLVRLRDLLDFQEEGRNRCRVALEATAVEAEAEDLYDRTDRPPPATRSLRVDGSPRSCARPGA